MKAKNRNLSYFLKVPLAVIMLATLTSILDGCGAGALGGTGTVTQAKSAEAASMHLRKAEGTVAINDAKGINVEVRENLGLYSGYGVGTQAASFAWVDLDSVKLTKLDEESRVTIEKDGSNLKINLESGNLFFHVTEPLGDDESMEIKTSTLLLGIRGTCGWVEAEDESTNVFLLEGKVEIESADGKEKANVLAGEMAAVSKDGKIVVEKFDKGAIPAFVLDETDDDSMLKQMIEEMAASEENAPDAESAVASTTMTKLDKVSTADETGLNLKEYKYSFEDREAAKEGEAVFYLADFEKEYNDFKLADSISLYAFNGKCIGHTKENIDINTIGRFVDWYYTGLDREYRFFKVYDVEKALAAASMPEASVPNTGGNAPAPDQTTAPVQGNAPVENNAPVEQAPAKSDKYTPEEAIAIYKSLMEAGGIIWDPDLKNGGSWGTGFYYLDKGFVEQAAESSLKSFAMGNGGQPWTRYYLEATGSDDECVYITKWHN